MFLSAPVILFCWKIRSKILFCWKRHHTDTGKGRDAWMMMQLLKLIMWSQILQELWQALVMFGTVLPTTSLAIVSFFFLPKRSFKNNFTCEAS